MDKISSTRYDAHSGGEREIQRTMLELLNQLDGFDSRGDVKVILATNKIESLDPALLRPGRIDRKIEFPLPDIKTRRRIFTVCVAYELSFVANKFWWCSLNSQIAIVVAILVK